MKRLFIVLIPLLFSCTKTQPTYKAVGWAPNNSELVPNWYIDPQNATTCASDTNNCTSKTCGSAGVGPCRTWGQVSQRLGSDPKFSTVLPVFDFLSAHTDKSDRVDFVPTIVATGNPQSAAPIVVIKAELPTGCSGTLGSLTAKNNTLTTTAAMLAASSACFTGTDLLILNTTRGTQAMTSQLRSGTTYSLTQPMNVSTGNEDNTWANGDSITVYPLTHIFFGRIGANGADPALLQLNNVTGWAPDGVGVNTVSVVGNQLTELLSGTMQPYVNDLSPGFISLSSTLQSGWVCPTGVPGMVAGSVRGPLSWTGTSATVSDDVEWINEGSFDEFETRGGNIVNGLYNDSIMLIGNGFLEVAPNSVLYGPGNIFATGRLEYFTSSAASTFHLAGGIECSNAAAPFGGQNACSINNGDGGAPAVINCGIPITNTALDTCPASSTAFCNIAWNPQGCMIGKGNF